MNKDKKEFLKKFIHDVVEYVKQNKSNNYDILPEISKNYDKVSFSGNIKDKENDIDFYVDLEFYEKKGTVFAKIVGKLLKELEGKKSYFELSLDENLEKERYNARVRVIGKELIKAFDYEAGLAMLKAELGK